MKRVIKLYQIDYGERIVFKRKIDNIYQVLIDKETKEEILYKDNNTKDEYARHSMFFEEESLDSIIKILEEDLKDAKEFAKEKFKGAVDKAGVNYFKGHISSVAKGTKTLQGEIVAYLHDIIEDTDVNYEEILDRFGYQTAQAVNYLTHRKNTPYLEYVEKLKVNPIAREVKMSDLTNNMDLSRLKEITDKDRKRLEKYKKAYVILEDER